MRRLLVVVAVLSLLSMANAASARPPASPRAPDDQAQSRLDAMSVRITDLFAQGLAREQVKAVMASEFGLRFPAEVASPVKAAPTAIPIDGHPSGQMVIMEQPVLAGEESDTGRLHMFATVRWRHDCDTGRGTKAPCWQNDNRQHGGPDGLAVHVTRPIVREKTGLTLRDNCGKYETIENPADSQGDFGVGYKAQDRSYKARPTRPEYAKDCAGDDQGRYQFNAYNWDFATVAASFFWQTECRNELVGIDSKYGHSWQRTSLTGIGIYADGISFSWANEGHNFEVIPNPPGKWQCG